MKKLPVLLIAAALAPVAGAQTKLDAGSRARLRSLDAPVQLTKDGKSTATVRQRAKTAQAERIIETFITISDESAVDRLSEAGATVASVRGDIVMATMPESALEAVSAIEGVRSISLAKAIDAKMDIARRVSGIDRIHAGEGLGKAYTGAGVLAGIVDGGFDPNHINFKNADGSSRIKQYTLYRTSTTGEMLEEVHDENYITRVETDDNSTFHGTHTLGIMAGGYRGKLNAAIADGTGFGATNQEVDNPYYGVAYGSDIATVAGASTDYQMALGIETILTYAYNHGRMPVVVNLSLGTNVGPHDGTSTICKYMDLATTSGQDNVIFCLSAGNEGDRNIAFHKTVSSTDDKVMSFMLPTMEITGYQHPRSGTVYVYSNDGTPFDIQAVVWNKSRGTAAMRMNLDAVTETTSKYWASSSDWAQADGDIVSPQFARYFEGYVGLNAETDALNGRYYSVIDFTTWDNVNTGGSNKLGNYILGFIVTPKKAGQRIDVYGDGTFCDLDDYGVEGASKGGGDGTISDIATGKHVVVVGSYNTRDDWPAMDGGIYGYQGTFAPGKMTDFTSYGELADGRKLPHVCAPGATVISSYSEYYTDGAGNAYMSPTTRNASYSDGTRTHSWFQCSGTSMAAPLVSGSLILWKEACPELNIDDIQDIIATTSVRDNDVATSGNALQWGAGKFDAYAGLKEVLRRAGAGVSDISADGDARLLISNQGGIYRATINGDSDFTLDLHSTAGALVMSAEAADGEVTFGTGAVAPGVYIATVRGRSDIAATRILVK